MKKKLIDLENKNPLNFVPKQTMIENKELKNILEWVKNPSPSNSQIHKYNETICDLHNEKIKHFVTFDPHTDEYLSKFHLNSSG